MDVASFKAGFMLSRGHDPTLVRSSITSLAVYDGLLDEPALALRFIALFHAC
jgi:hypothetical protein